jgi:hypothetical protein
MANYKKDSVNRIIDSLQSSFEFSSASWKLKAVEHIGRGLEIIGTTSAFIKKATEKQIVSGRAILPCDIEALIQIEYEGQEVVINNIANFINECSNVLPCHPFMTGQINGNVLHTNIDEGYVTFHYLAIEVDDKGYPLIPDNPLVYEALEWFVMYKLLVGGHKHHSIKDWREAYSMWVDLYPQAQNDLAYPSVPKFAKFMKVWNTVTITPYELSNFN